MKLNVGLQARFHSCKQEPNFTNNNSLADVVMVAVAYKVHQDTWNSTRKSCSTSVFPLTHQPMHCCIALDCCCSSSIASFHAVNPRHNPCHFPAVIKCLFVLNFSFSYDIRYSSLPQLPAVFVSVGFSMRLLQIFPSM